METQLGAKNQKKISNGQGCRTGTDARTNARTNARTYESEFIGSFRSLKTSGEPIKRSRLSNEQTTIILYLAKGVQYLPDEIGYISP